MNHQRSREEIEAIVESLATDNNNYDFFRSMSMKEIEIELLLDIRDLLQNPPVEVRGECIECRASTSGLCNTHENKMEQKFYAAVPEQRDELYERAKFIIGEHWEKGETITIHGLSGALQIPFGRASNIIDDLAKDGIIKRDGRGKPWRVC
jgi:hypothetical protein